MSPRGKPAKDKFLNHQANQPESDSSKSATALGDWTQALHLAGLRATPKRIALLETLEKHPHISAPELLELCKNSTTLTKQAIYINLAELNMAGIIRTIDVAGIGTLYEVNHQDNHHHLVCTRCSAIVNVDCEVGRAPCLNPTYNHGFVIEVANVTFKGLCTECQNLKNKLEG